MEVSNNSQINIKDFFTEKAGPFFVKLGSDIKNISQIAGKHIAAFAKNFATAVKEHSRKFAELIKKNPVPAIISGVVILIGILAIAIGIAIKKAVTKSTESDDNVIKILSKPKEIKLGKEETKTTKVDFPQPERRISRSLSLPAELAKTTKPRTKTL